MSLKAFTVKIPKALYERLSNIADANDTSLSCCLRAAIGNYISDMEHSDCIMTIQNTNAQVDLGATCADLEQWMGFQ